MQIFIYQTTDVKTFIALFFRNCKPTSNLFFHLSLQSDTRQTPPYSPQPSPYSQGSVSPQNSKNSPSSSTSAGHPKPSQSKKVQPHVFSFAHPHPGPFRPGLSALGLLPTHPSQPPLIPGPWPVHGPIIQGSGASSSKPAQHASSPGMKFAVRGGTGGGQAVSAATMNLNDPSIIYAQPSAGRVTGGVGGPGRDRGHHWQNHHLNPGPLVGNGTVGNKTGTRMWFSQ